MHYSREENENKDSPDDMSNEDDNLLSYKDSDLFVFVQDRMICNFNEESGIPSK